MMKSHAAVLAAVFVLEISMANIMTAEGKTLLRNSEACPLLAYDDLRPKVILKPGDSILGRLSIAGGHTGTKPMTDKPLQIGDTCTQQEADEQRDLDEAAAEKEIAALIPGNVQLTNNQFSVLVDLSYNLGIGGFERSSVYALVRKNQLAKVPAELKLYVYSKGMRMAGLVTRRTLEAHLWNTPDDAPPQIAAEQAPAPSVTPDHPNFWKRFKAWLDGAYRLPTTAGATP